MSEREYIVNFGDDRSRAFVRLAMAEAENHGAKLREEIIRCRDCRHLDDREARHLACNLLSMNEWRMDGDRRVAETSFLEVEPDGYCVWGEGKVDE